MKATYFLQKTKGSSQFLRHKRRLINSFIHSITVTMPIFNMFRCRLVVLLICSFSIFDVQALKAIVRDIYFEDRNTTRIGDDSTAELVDEREHTVKLKIRLLKSVESDNLMVGFELLGASMGEYVIPSGIEVEMKFCEMIGDEVIAGPFLEKLGFSADNCHPSAGVYEIENYKPPFDLMPDSFVPNDYKLSYKIWSDSVVILKIVVLAEIN